MKKPIKKIPEILFSFLVVLLALPFLSATPGVVSPKSNLTVENTSPIDSASSNIDKVSSLYDNLDLENAGLSREVFNLAMKGYETLLNEGQVVKSSVITIIDFSKPSTEKRFYVLDIDSMKLLFQTYVAHGMKSGALYANHFSNKSGSHMSSLGFYITGNTYFGQHGYSLKLNGEEAGINDNAQRRAIVIHSADYASDHYVQKIGYLGRSYGCPALPREVSGPIIETIKEGSCLFVYAPNEKYLSKSQLL